MRRLSNIGLASVAEFIMLDEKPALEAINILDSAPPFAKFVVVVNSRMELIGTVSDGDIRRGLLNGNDILSPISFFMNTAPKYLHANFSPAEVDDALRDVKSAFPFLPVLDKKMKVVDVLVKDGHRTKRVAALIMAGGYGKRLGSRTKSQPKPLVEVDGKPLLEYALSQIEASCAEEIYISTFYLSEQILQYLKDTGRDKSVHLIEENRPLGTAGAIGLLPHNNFDKLIVTNADVLTELNFDSILNFHWFEGKSASIAVAEHHVHIPFGVINHDADGHLLSISEKPVIKNFVAAGIYCFPNSVVPIVDVDQKMDMPELLARMIADGYKIRTFPIHEYWSDVGTPEDLARASREFVRP